MASITTPSKAKWMPGLYVFVTFRFLSINRKKGLGGPFARDMGARHMCPDGRPQMGRMTCNYLKKQNNYSPNLLFRRETILATCGQTLFMYVSTCNNYIHMDFSVDKPEEPCQQCPINRDAGTPVRSPHPNQIGSGNRAQSRPPRRLHTS